VQQKIVPNLWFNGNAKEAVDYYISVFPESSIVSIENYPDSAEEGLADFQLDLAGKPLVIEFMLNAQHFTAKPYLLRLTVKTKKKLIIIGTNYQVCLKPNSVAGVRINLV
jgi:predicted 3-demethylubiquinone-9 3-methyltransferase (glyoxalase superfamily)